MNYNKFLLNIKYPFIQKVNELPNKINIDFVNIDVKPIFNNNYYIIDNQVEIDNTLINYFFNNSLFYKITSNKSYNSVIDSIKKYKYTYLFKPILDNYNYLSFYIVGTNTYNYNITYITDISDSDIQFNFFIKKLNYYISKFYDTAESNIIVNDFRNKYIARYTNKISALYKLNIPYIYYNLDNLVFYPTKHYDKLQIPENRHSMVTNYSESLTNIYMIKDIIDIDLSELTICDATAGIGGDSIIFGKFFNRVICIEVDPIIHKALSNNISLYDFSHKFDIYEPISFKNIFTKINCDVVFFDPPWTPLYKEKQIFNLYLDKVNVIDYIKYFTLSNIKLVCLRAPYNYNINHLITSIEQSYKILIYKVYTNLTPFLYIYIYQNT